MSGTVYWITGLAGAGKSTIGKALYNQLSKQFDNLVFLDGDEIREIFGNDLGYSEEDRRKNAFRISRLCKYLSDQGIHVVCSTISMFHDVRDWNRKHITNYKEIYLKVPIDLLVKRDQKGLYSKAISGEITNVLGITSNFEEPKAPDLVLHNDGSRSPEAMAEAIAHYFLQKG